MPSTRPSTSRKGSFRPTSQPTRASSDSTGGTDTESHCIYIAGAYDNLPSLLEWCEYPSNTMKSHHNHSVFTNQSHNSTVNKVIIHGISGTNHSITGLVTILTYYVCSILTYLLPWLIYISIVVCGWIIGQVNDFDEITPSPFILLIDMIFDW